MSFNVPSKVWLRGFIANAEHTRCGSPEGAEDNPYYPGTDEFQQWSEGWLDFYETENNTR